MRSRLQKKALTRFVIGMSAAAIVPATMLATIGAPAAPVAIACASVAALLSVSAMSSPRRRVTRRTSTNPALPA